MPKELWALFTGDPNIQGLGFGVNGDHHSQVPFMGAMYGS